VQSSVRVRGTSLSVSGSGSAASRGRLRADLAGLAVSVSAPYTPSIR
jgi:hypothetical protein